MKSDLDSKGSILIVDDRDDLYLFCARILGNMYAFHRVASGREAREYLTASAEPDAILLDRDFTYTPAVDMIGPPEEFHDEGVHILRWLRREQRPCQGSHCCWCQHHRTLCSAFGRRKVRGLGRLVLT